MPSTDELRNCVEACWACRDSVQKTLFHHCLAMGGAHTEQTHVQAMFDCIQMCQIAADFMTRESQAHGCICRACAEVTRQCAQSCIDIGGDEMEECAVKCMSAAKCCLYIYDQSLKDAAWSKDGDGHNGPDGHRRHA